MMSLYTLCVDITAKTNLSENTFRELIAPQIAYLDALQGAFEKKPCNVFFYPPDPDTKNSRWSARCVVAVSIGRERAVYLFELYHLLAQLINTELQHQCSVQYEPADFRFS